MFQDINTREKDKYICNRVFDLVVQIVTVNSWRPQQQKAIKTQLFKRIYNIFKC